jgi:hypothetical protein
MFRREGKDGRWGREKTILFLYAYVYRIWGMYVYGFADY